MLWLALFSPLAALTFLMVMERFEKWMLAATPARPAVRPSRVTRRKSPLEPATPVVSRALVPHARTPQSS
jgi:hypothetical protein